MFLISFLLVIISTYFFVSLFNKTKRESFGYGFGVLTFLILAFAQIVLSFEVLSLFSAIKSQNVLIANSFFFVLSVVLWIKKGKPLYIPKFKATFSRIFKALKKDKFLMIMAFGFLFFLINTTFINIYMPVMNLDSLAYHLNRVAFWLSQCNLNHFVIADDRNLFMPINSEILYMWVMVFLKKDIGLFFFSFVGVISCLISVYNILHYWGFCERKKLWTVFILASLPPMIIEASSVETNILLASLILSSVLLFLIALKEKRFSIIYLSSLAYALALGTKSTSFIIFPAVFLLLVYCAYNNNKKEFLKPISAYLLCMFINFLVFSSYNYILNYIDFGDFLGNQSARALHSFRGGIKAFVANFIRYIFLMFDFSGFSYSNYVGVHINNLKLAILNFLHIPPALGIEQANRYIVNNKLIDMISGTGLLGFLLFLPSVIVSGIIFVLNKIRRVNNRKTNFLFVLSIVFFINLICLSFALAYMVFSVRFVTTMVVISSPILVLSYFKKNYILKCLILFYVMSYFLVMSTHLLNRLTFQLIDSVKKYKTVEDFRSFYLNSTFDISSEVVSYVYLVDYMRKFPQNSSFGIFMNYSSLLFRVKLLETEGFKVDTLFMDNLDNYDLKKYDYIIVAADITTSTIFEIDEKNKFYQKDSLEKNNLYCVYGKQKLKNDLPNGREIITSSRCMVNNKFFENYGFELYIKMRYEIDNDGNVDHIRIFKKVNK